MKRIYNLILIIKLPGAKVRYGAPCSVVKGRRVMMNEATLAILAWDIKLILISIANKAIETCLEANISI